MSKRFTDTNKYKKAFFRSLPGAYKLFWDYLYHDCDHAGIWHVDIEIAQIYLGKDMQIDKETALDLFNAGEERVRVLNNGAKWLIIPFIEFQYGELNPANRVHASIISLLSQEKIKGLTSSFEGAKDKEQDKDKDKDKDKDIGAQKVKKFTPPSIAEVSEYCRERGNTVSPNKFLNHYESNGWKVGKNPMKDWRAAVRTWEQSDSGGGNGQVAVSSGGARGSRVKQLANEALGIGRSGTRPPPKFCGGSESTEVGRGVGFMEKRLGATVIEGSVVEAEETG